MECCLTLSASINTSLIVLMLFRIDLYATGDILSELNPSGKSPQRYSLLSLHVVLSFLFVFLVLVVGSVLAVLDYQRGRQLANKASAELFEHVGQEMAQQINVLYTPISQLIGILAREELVRDTTFDERMRHVSSWAEVMRGNIALSALYVGYGNGDFFLVRKLNRSVKTILNVAIPDDAAFMIQSVTRNDNNTIHGIFLFLNDDLEQLQKLEREDYLFDPRTRQWYQQAINTSQQLQTRPYKFYSTGEPGITITQRSPKGDSVVGADLSLAHLSNMLDTLKLSPSAELALVEKDRTVLAYRKASLPGHIDVSSVDIPLPQLAQLSGKQFAMLAKNMEQKHYNQPIDTVLDDQQWLGRIVPLNLKGDTIYLVISMPADELMAEAKRLLRDGLIITFLLLLASIPLASLVAWRLGVPLRRLAHEAEAIQNFDFTQPAKITSRIREVDILNGAINDMRSTIRRFTEISLALAAENDYDRLLERILTETISIAQSTAGALYLLDGDSHIAQPQIAKWADSDAKILPSAFDMHEETYRHHALCRALSSGHLVTETMRVTDGRLPGWFGRSPEHLSGSEYMLAAIPLKNRADQSIGVILLLSSQKETDVQPHLFAFLEALSGTAAISIENRQLIKGQKQLLESFIQMVAGAIDTKSPYTGGHCQRVPELTSMLAQAACESQQGPFEKFDLSEQQWEALHIASWMHDCGKMTTPEYVVDKATKLETLYDRIHEIRMRFEVLKRDRMITHLETLLKGGNPIISSQLLQEELQRLDDDFAFVAKCNEGTEYMPPEKLMRLLEISQHQWLRTLDDRIGISWEERQRKERTPAPKLPVYEYLLADREDHKIARSQEDRMGPDNPWGFRISEPDLRYNRGEIYNLSITRGTLTQEERYQINDHIVQTIIMLSRLPFPPHLQTVPEIAGGHHEKMNGTGYPRRLTKEQMSPLARMMAIADIFEALTAADRPYKKAKKLSETLAIMQSMADEGHIDPDIFSLFISSGVHLRYAKKYMAPDNIDVDDVLVTWTAAVMA